MTWIADLDGTLALRTDRHWFDWSRVGEDLPNEPVVAVVSALIAAGHEIRYMSGRKEQCREATVSWLRRYVDPFVSPAHLFMRADDDNRPDEIVKRELFEVNFSGVQIDAVIDDRAKVVRMWRDELGLPVLQCADGDF